MQILWENLASSRTLAREVVVCFGWLTMLMWPGCDRFGRRMVTALITFLLILFSFVMVLSSSYSQNQFMSLVRARRCCDALMPWTPRAYS